MAERDLFCHSFATRSTMMYPQLACAGLVIGLLIASPTDAFGQEEKPEVVMIDGTLVHQFPDSQAEPIGGLRAIQRRVRYPHEAKMAGVEGQILVRFVVNEEGRTQSIEVFRGIGFGCDLAAIRAIERSKFRPATKDGQKVASQLALPIGFWLK